VSSGLSVRLTEIFHSLQGEARTVGRPTVFVRLTGCPLRCTYCDTAYAFEGGKQHSLDSVLAQVAEHSADYVTVTGGEPLAQPAAIQLMQRLCDAGYQVSLETGGAMPIDDVDDRVSIVLDLKTPASGECDRNLLANVPLLRPKDQVKFVICDRGDYEWSKAQVHMHDLGSRVDDILFSPSYEELAPALLAQWVLEDRLKVRMQLQLHKQIWGDEKGV
jgi:7-carboxy-7-deazaguanine synthase